MVIFHCITRNFHNDLLQAWHRAQHRELHINRQRCAYPVVINEMCVDPLGFQKNLMAVTVAKPVNLVLDGRAIAWARCADSTCEHGRSVQIGPDGIMRGLGRPCDRAENLGVGAAFNERRHCPMICIRRLFFQACPIDGASIQTRRCSGFQPSHRQIGGAQLSGKLLS